MLKWITAAACLGAAMAQAQSSALSGQQIGDLVAGATVEIDTPLGTKLPVRYTRDGRLSGEAGGLASYLGTVTDKGRWWIASDQLCHKWNRWFGSEPQCMRLSRVGRIIHWRSQDGYTGTAMISVPPTIQAGAIQAGAIQAEPIPLRAQPDQPKQIDPRENASAPASAPEEPPARPTEGTDLLSQQAAEETAAPPSPETLPSAKTPPEEAPPAKAPPPVQVAATPSANSPQPQPEPRRAAQPMFRVVNVRGDDVLNVRSGPSADFDIVGGLPPGSRGIAITNACRATWCPVQHRSTSGWVNSAYLALEGPSSPVPRYSSFSGSADALAAAVLQDGPDTPRTCLTPAARALLDRIERQFGPVKIMPSCRPGAFMPGTAQPSRHASGNAVDFLAGSRKAAIVEWLIANHRDGGTMTYAGMDHIHVDIGPHFVSIANGPRWLSWRDGSRHFPGPQRPISSAN